MSRFGIRRKLKGALKRALGSDQEAPPPPSPAPQPPPARPPRNEPRPAPPPGKPLFARSEPVDEEAGKGRIWVQVKGLVPDEFPVGTVRPVELFGRRYALARTDEGFFAALDRCPHAGGSLGEGELKGGVIACSMHGYEFDLHDGSCESDPDLVASIVEVMVQDDKIFVETDR